MRFLLSRVTADAQNFEGEPGYPGRIEFGYRRTEEVLARVHG